MLPAAFDFFCAEGPRCTALSGSLSFMILWDDIHVRQLLDFLRDLALLQIAQIHHINDVLPEIVLAGVGFMAQAHTHTHKETSSQKSQACDF